MKSALYTVCVCGVKYFNKSQINLLCECSDTVGVILFLSSLSFKSQPHGNSYTWVK